MAAPTIQFNDGAAYDRMMGVWSQLVGEAFLDWLAPATELVWADIGCGSGAFSELIAARCKAAAIHGIDPSEGQLSQARAKPPLRGADLRQGDAMALPYADATMDAAVMALVLFFVPDPARGVAEMARVVRPGGSVSAYMWDSLSGGSPNEPFAAELRAMGKAIPNPPSEAASGLDVMRALWQAAGLEAIGTKVITVRRTFVDFDSFWSISITNPRVAGVIAKLDPAETATLQSRLKARQSADAQGRITCEARANAIKGRKKLD
jgi:SAM-dependent methyltransferase